MERKTRGVKRAYVIAAVAGALALGIGTTTFHAWHNTPPATGVGGLALLFPALAAGALAAIAILAFTLGLARHPPSPSRDAVVNGARIAAAVYGGALIATTIARLNTDDLGDWTTGWFLFGPIYWAIFGKIPPLAGAAVGLATGVWLVGRHEK